MTVKWQLHCVRTLEDTTKGIRATVKHRCDDRYRVPKRTNAREKTKFSLVESLCQFSRSVETTLCDKKKFLFFSAASKIVLSTIGVVWSIVESLFIKEHVFS